MLQVLSQLPLKHASPGAHSLPHAPQLTLSESRFAQYEPASPASASHRVCVVGQLALHRPATHARPAQTLPHAPQFAGSICRLVQSEPHTVCSAGQPLRTVPSLLASAVDFTSALASAEPSPPRSPVGGSVGSAPMQAASATKANPIAPPHPRILRPIIIEGPLEARNDAQNDPAKLAPPAPGTHTGAERRHVGVA